jgi:non-heme chloroperoxidase
MQESAPGRTLRYRSRRVTTPDGVTVAVQDWAHEGAPRKAELLLLHGFSQAHGAWLHQVTSPLAAEYRLVTYDLRGHGDSDKPTAAHFYREPERWAGEVNAVIDQSGLQRPILVAWSYAGRVALDYLSVLGDAGIGGLVMAGATANSDPKMMGPAVGLLQEMTSDDDAVALEGTKALLRASVAKPLPPEEFDYMLRYNQSVPATIRANLAGRPADYASALRSVSVPTLVMQGMLDPIITPAMAAYTAQQVPGAELLCYDDLAHMPFWESPQRFNTDLAEFVSRRVVAPRSNRHQGPRGSRP